MDEVVTDSCHRWVTRAIVHRLLNELSQDRSIIGRIGKRLLQRVPPLAKTISLRDRLILKDFPRIQYAYCVARAADLASSLGYKHMTVIEFGVAGGKGLLALEATKEIVESYIPIEITIVGFDAGSGLPDPVDYRDLPYHWQGGFYEMDIPLLKSKLKYARLEIGPVGQTLPAFVSQHHDAPIGAISFDLDLYSSTMEAFRIFELDVSSILPRVMCCMDDIVGTVEHISDFTGERLAIDEFNQRSKFKKLSHCYDFEDFPIERWQQRIITYHDFSHPRYNEFVGKQGEDQLPL